MQKPLGLSKKKINKNILIPKYGIIIMPNDGII